MEATQERCARQQVTLGKLRLFPATEEGTCPVSGRLECLDCEPPVTLLFRHAGLGQDLSLLHLHAGQVVPLDHQHRDNWVVLSPTRPPTEASWPEPEDFLGWCVALLNPPGGSRYGYEFEAELKLVGWDERIGVQFTHEEHPHHFFKAVTFEADTAILVEFGMPYAQRYMSRRQFEDEVARWREFGELLAERDAPLGQR